MLQLPSSSFPGRPGDPPHAAARFGAAVVSHPMVDAYAGFVPPLIGVLQVRCDLTVWQAASLLSIGPLMSGLCQPVFAWLTDRIDSRLFGSAGLATAAVCLSCVGLAGSYGVLLLMFAVGMMGVGAFHPVAAASVGQLAGRRRSAGVTVFFVAGMIGATTGPILSTRITSIEPGGFDLLRWLMIPGLLFALVLHRAIGDVPHRHHDHASMRCRAGELRRRWGALAALFCANAMRYSVNIAMLYLFVRWAEASVSRGDATLSAASVAQVASLYAGELNAATMLSIGAGGLLGGLIIRQGREKRPLVLLPLLLAPAIALFPFVGRAGTYVLAALAGLGYGAVIPVTISLAQRLLPHRTSLASGLVMGGAWSMAAIAAPTAEWCVRRAGLTGAFAAVACVLAASGFAALPLPGRLLRSVAASHGLGDAGH